VAQCDSEVQAYNSCLSAKCTADAGACVANAATNFQADTSSTGCEAANKQTTALTCELIKCCPECESEAKQNQECFSNLAFSQVANFTCEAKTGDCGSSPGSGSSGSLGVLLGTVPMVVAAAGAALVWLI